MVFNILKSKRAEGSISTALTVVISVVLGGLVLLGSISLIDTTVGPALASAFSNQQNESLNNPVDFNSSSIEYQLGDINTDGKINKNDVEYLERFLNGWEGYTVVGEYSDINDDGLINEADLRELQGMLFIGDNGPEQNETIPEGGIYLSGVVTAVYDVPSGMAYSVKYTAGDTFPTNIQDNDIYIYGDYYYIFSDEYYINGACYSGWAVVLLTENTGPAVLLLEEGESVDTVNKNQTSYGSVLESINGQPVAMMNYTYQGCTNLTVAPSIPKEVVCMDYAFESCYALSGTISVPCHITTLSWSGCPTTAEVYHYDGCGH